MDAKADVQKQAERREFNRKLVLFVHVLAGFFTALIYLSQVNISRFPSSQRLASLYVFLIAAPPLLPYIVSGVHSWRTASYDRLRVSLFLLVILLGAFGVGCAILGLFSLSLDRSTLLWTFAIQAAVYYFAAEFLFDTAED